MMVNADTLAALQIFESEAHANIHAQDAKEGLSLYSTRPPLPPPRALLTLHLLQLFSTEPKLQWVNSFSRDGSSSLHWRSIYSMQDSTR